MPRGEALEIQLVNIDSYTAPPSADFDCALNAPFNVFEVPLLRVPVIRVFGATREQRRVCLHIHQAWPYICVPCPEVSNIQAVRSFGYQLGRSLNHALNLALKGIDTLHVAAVIPVKGVPFYGYSAGYRPFLKIQFSSPHVVSRAGDLLASGAVMERRFDVFEAHLPFTLQFLVDYNLYGMGWIQLENVKFRHPLADTSGLVADAAAEGAPMSPLDRTSHCEIEADITVVDIVNRRRVHERRIHHKFLEDGSDLDSGRLVHSLDIIWSDENKRRAHYGLDQLRPADVHGGLLSGASGIQTRPLLRWSNHWRIQSQFESALAEDRRRQLSSSNSAPNPQAPKKRPTYDEFARALRQHNPNQHGVDSSWLDMWPTCREVDLGVSGLTLGGNSCGNGFYSNPCSEADLLPAEACSTRLLGAPDGTGALPCLKGVLVDADIIATSSIEDQTIEHHKMCSSDDGSDACSAFDELADMDSSWLESEISRAERADEAYSSGGKSSPGFEDACTIPQLDGADDAASRRESSAQGSRRRGGQTSTSRRPKRRVLRPLNLVSSGAAPRAVQQAATFAKQSPPLRRGPERQRRKGKITLDGGTTYDTRQISTSPCRQESDIYPGAGHIDAEPCRPSTPVEDGCQMLDSAEHGGVSSSAHAVAMEPPVLQDASYLDGAYQFGRAPPSSQELLDSMARSGVAEVVTQPPCFPKGSETNQLHRPDCRFPSHSVSRKVDGLQLFGPGYAQYGDTVCALEAERLLAERRDRRYAMWALAAAREQGRVDRSKVGSLGGWWEYARRPPNRKHLHTGMTPVASTAKSFVSPVQRRQRDQSDLKWGSVLGMLTQRATPASETQAGTDRFSSDHKVPMTLVSAEALTDCRPGMLPDPKYDSIFLIIACFATEGKCPEDKASGALTIMWTCEPGAALSRLGLPSYIERRHHASELSMLRDLAAWTRQVDPDILCGYETRRGSWGFLVERAEHVHGLSLDSALSRVVQRNFPGKRKTETGRLQGSRGHDKGLSARIVGRHVLNVWRLMRSELSLTSYSFERVAKELLGEQTPHHSNTHLAAWFRHGPAVARIRAVRYALYRAKAVLRMLLKADIVTRTAEFASVIGIDFLSVLTRGSQFRVESLMARIARPELYVLPSPTRQQVAQQRAAECLPLVLEPRSHYYTDPVIVLDFQSLYPSIMIAYNYCFSTCLGSVEEYANSSRSTGPRLGFTHVDAQPGALNTLKDQVTISPNGIIFVKPEVRRGLLGRMLCEILSSRMVIKDAIQQCGSHDELLRKRLDTWQLGLKLIANVTYGYAGASFSGRMPCVEIADAIVQSGRETLESAIRLVHSRHARWGGEVIYGDTDSIFVHLPGKTRKAAFRIGQEIAAAVTQLNPEPVKLRFEKVYHPCVLLTKKRYAGWMFTSAGQAEPQLDVKGMELVRRDGCSVTQRVLEGTMNLLFGSNDLASVKAYVTEQIGKVLRGAVPMPEFIIAKETRMGGYSGRVLPAHAAVAHKRMARDPQAEPEHGERVPYVVVCSSSNSRLVDRVVSPQTLLAQPQLRLDVWYYVEKQIAPALDRILGLVGVDVQAWISQMPRHTRRSSLYGAMALSDQYSSDSSDETAGAVDERLGAGRPRATVADTTGRRAGGTTTLDGFYRKRNCILCGQIVADSAPQSPECAETRISPAPATSSAARARGICGECCADEAAMTTHVVAMQMDAGRRLKAVLDTCARCVGGPRAEALQAAELCDCLDCPSVFQRIALSRDFRGWSRALPGP